MTTPEECVCCKEIEEVSAKVESFSSDSGPIHCITEHEGFDSVINILCIG